MNPLTLILLAFFAYFFYSTGAMFLAFLVLVVALVFALSSATSQSGSNASHGAQMGGHGGGGVQPIIIGNQQPVAAFPRKFEFRPNFPGDPDGDEWISSRIGLWIVMFARMIGRVFGGMEKKKEH